jgi:hypothetical protein
MIDQQSHERAKDDAKTANDLARVAAQSTILINGGAATATLAFIGSMARDGQLAKVVLPLLPIPLCVYALGVFFAAASLLVMSKSIETYQTVWEGEGEPNRALLATKLWWAALALVALGLISFIGASGYLASRIDQVQL